MADPDELGWPDDATDADVTTTPTGLDDAFRRGSPARPSGVASGGAQALRAPTERLEPSARPGSGAKPGGTARAGKAARPGQAARPAKTAKPGRAVRRGRGAGPGRGGDRAAPARPAKARSAGTSRLAAGSSRRPGQATLRSRPRTGRGLVSAVARIPRRVQLLGGLAIVAVLAITGYLLLLPQPGHVVSVPAGLNGYVRQSAQASLTARQLKSRIVAGAGGAVRNVVAASYEKSTGPGTSAGPQVIVFIGGNLSSGSSFIGGLSSQLHGSFATSAGPLGGEAVCAPGTSGGPAECAWADGDTFGVLVSATLNAAGLASEMRVMRPLVEHVVK